MNFKIGSYFLLFRFWFFFCLSYSDSLWTYVTQYLIKISTSVSRIGLDLDLGLRVRYLLMSCTYVTPRSAKLGQAASLRTIGRGFFFICSADQNCNYRRRRHCLPCPVLEKSCPKIINLFHFYLFKGWIALLPHELNLNLQNWYHILIHYWAWLLLHLLSRSELQLPAAPPLFTMPGFRKIL